MSQNNDQGHIGIFDSKKCEIRRKDSGKLVGTAVRTPRNVYILENEEQCYLSQFDEIFISHTRMGHLNFDNLVKNSQKGVVRNIPKNIKQPNHVCRQCLHGLEHTTS